MQVRQVKQSRGHRQTFILPFIVAFFLGFPSLLMIAYSKQAVGFDLLIASGLFQLVLTALWILVPVMLVSAVLYAFRGYGRASKSAVLILAVVALICFIYVLIPQS
jgi:hypothetical protein